MKVNHLIGVMIQGTASNVGKSYLVAAICRLLVNEGFSVAPFKSQNMTSHVFILEDGKEIGKSQYYQAKAAKVRPTTSMNPILLKPVDQGVEVLLFGDRVTFLSGYAFRDKFYEKGLQAIQTALLDLKLSYDVIVMEGAGSPVELNLKARELVNMKVAELADVPVILVADIDRGGVFASVVGTIALFSEEERARVKGIVINKFRGDLQMFAEGVHLLEEQIGIPVIGVIPWLEKQFDSSHSFDDQATHVQAHIDWNMLTNIIFQRKDR